MSQEIPTECAKPSHQPGLVQVSSDAVDYTNSQRKLRGVITSFSLAVRRKFYQSFVDAMAPTPETTILDVGVTPDQTTADSNYLEKWYPYPERLSATSIEDASYLMAAHPGLTFIQTSADRLPFPDRHFDVVFSSAVIEHTGDRQRQQQFLSELLRVSGRFFITTPNRWFPLELHTFLPVLHWLPQHQHQRILRRLGQSSWARTENLNLLDQRSLRSLFPPGVVPTVAGPRILGIRSNLIAFGSSIPNEHD
jgi:SAM-dependent methyltransferase